MVRVSTAAFHGIVPESMIPSLPFLFRDLEHFRKTMYGPQGDKILAAFDKAGFVGLALYESGARSIYAKKPIKSVADMKGLKVRVQPSDLMVSLVSAIGASPTPMPFAEVYTGPEDRPARRGREQHPVVRRGQALRVGAGVFGDRCTSMTPEVLVFSKKVWDTLTPGRAGGDPQGGEGVGALLREAVGREGEGRTRRGAQGRREDRSRGRDRHARASSRPRSPSGTSSRPRPS